MQLLLARWSLSSSSSSLQIEAELVSSSINRWMSYTTDGYLEEFTHALAESIQQDFHVFVSVMMMVNDDDDIQ